MSTPDPIAAGPVCRAPLHPLVRFATLFGVLYPARVGLRLTPLHPVAQTALVAALASGLVWWMWAPCSARRRGLALMIGSLWAAVALQAALTLSVR